MAGPRAGWAAADADARVGEEEPGTLVVAQLFPGLVEDGGMAAVDAERAAWAANSA